MAITALPHSYHRQHQYQQHQHPQHQHEMYNHSHHSHHNQMQMQTPIHDVAVPPQPQQGEDVLSLFVSDLSPQAVEDDIYRLFHFPMEHLPADAFGKVYIYPFNITDVRIVAGDSGNSKYAFVRFPSIAERTRALYIMQGVLCVGRPSQYPFLPSSYPPVPSPRSHFLQSGSLVPMQRTAIANLSASSSSPTLAQRMSANGTMSSSTPSMLSGPRSTPRTQRSLSAAFLSAFSCKTSSPALLSWALLPMSTLARAAPSFHSPASSKPPVLLRPSTVLSSTASPSASPGVAVVVCPILLVPFLSLTMSTNHPLVQPLLQQQRTFVPVVPTDSTKESAKSDTASVDSGSPLSRSPSSPITPITPATPANLSLPSLGSSTRSKLKTPRGSTGSFSSGISHLYTLREADEAHGLEQSMAAMDLSAPSLKRRSTLGSIRNGFEHEPFATSKPMLRGESLGPTMPLARRVSLPEA